MFKRLKYFIKRKPKASGLITVALIALASFGIPMAVHAGYGPSDRATYDWNKYNSSVSCTDPSNAYGRCGSMTGPVFDSFINTPSYGDEENFNQIAPVVNGQSPQDATYSGTATATPGEEYWVRTLVHNDANQNLNCEPQHDDATTDDCTQVDPGSPSIATGTTVKVAIANGVANGVDIMSYISANNSTPGTIWDSSTLQNNNQAFSVSYVNGSAVIYNNAYPNGLPLSDNIDSANGTPIGYQQMDGNLPGCFNYSAYVYVKVLVQAPALQIQKEVRADSTAAWSSNITTTAGSTVQWKIVFTDSGSTDDNDLTIRDALPNGLTIVPGSIKWYDANNNGTILQDTSLGSGGVDLGNYAPATSGPNGEIVFDTTVSNPAPTCTITNTGYGRADNVPEVSSSASLTISNCNVTPPKPPTPPTPPTPTYACTLLNVTQSGQTVTISQFNESATNGATFDDAVINWGDNSQQLTTNNVVGQTHNYTGNGPFPISAVAYFTVPGQSAPVTPATNGCTASVTFTPPAATLTAAVTPAAPAQLANTGPGNVIEIFVGVTILGAIAHRLFWSRRKAHQVL